MPESVGKRIKVLRTKQGMTLAKLGEGASLSASYLSQIERDKAAPSLSTLMDIARALNVDPRYFFEVEAEAVYIHRADRGKDNQVPSRRIERLRLTTKLGSSQLEAYRVILQPHTAPEQLEKFSGEGFGFVLAGELTIKIGDEQFALAGGDSIHYDAFQPNCWSNAGDQPCVVIWGRAASLQDH